MVQEFLNDEKQLEQKRKKVIDALLEQRKNIDLDLAAVGYRVEGNGKKRGRPKKGEALTKA